MQMTSMTEQSMPLGFVQNLVLKTCPVVCCIALGRLRGSSKETVIVSTGKDLKQLETDWLAENITADLDP